LTQKVHLWLIQYIFREEGRRLTVRVNISDEKREKSLFPQCKTSTSNRRPISASITQAFSMGLWLRRIEWCDRHLCHV